MSQVVFAEPENTEARALGADALEQLGYQSESATWRNAYLQGARELRGAFSHRPPLARGLDIVRGLSLDLFFDFLGVRLNGEKAEGKTIVVNWEFPDTGQRYASPCRTARSPISPAGTRPRPTAPSPSTAPPSTASSYAS
jgi:alkyl sulfatase BDS1-like metallo-beta-lactamase superfamily hydrolase